MCNWVLKARTQRAGFLPHMPMCLVEHGCWVDCVRRLSVVVFQLRRAQGRKVLVDLTVGSKREGFETNLAFPVQPELIG